MTKETTDTGWMRLYRLGNSVSTQAGNDRVSAERDMSKLDQKYDICCTDLQSTYILRQSIKTLIS